MQNNLNAYNNSGETKLIKAIKNNNINEVNRLIEAGVDVDKEKLNGGTPIFIASQEGYLDIVDRLINAGADINKSHKTAGATPIYIASQNGHLTVVERLIAAGADINKARIDQMKLTPLAIAISNKYYNVVDILINAGADINTPIANGYTPLILAVVYKSIEIVDRLIAAGADVNKTAKNKVSPIYFAVKDESIEIIDHLIAAGANINILCNITTVYAGDAPLHIAIFLNNIKIIDRLIAAGADVNIANKYTGNTGLHYAAENENVKIVHRLISAGARKDIKNTRGKLPIDLTKNKEIRNLLEEKLEKNTALKWQGWTQGDASMLDGIFAEDEVAKNFALCPVCMKYVVRSEACMYMTHDCSSTKGYYNTELYNKYKNSDRQINWCTICGRVCKGHNHYKLSSAQGDVPSIIVGKDPFASSCEGEGGGGIKEKLLRFRRLREYARDLQEEVGKIGWWEAMDELCEEMWNAPLARSRALTKMLETKKFNIPHTNFPLTLPAQNNAPNIPYTGQLPILHAEETEDITNALFIDDINLIQFRHKKSNGTTNLHNKPGQQISRAAFIEWLKTQLEDPSAEGFGKCWQYKTVSQQSVLSNAEKANSCDAILHPNEVKAALDLTNPEQASLSEGYRKAFNAVMDPRKIRR